MIDLHLVEEHIWVLTEDGENVLLKDSQKFGLRKTERRALFESLRTVARYLKKGWSLNPLIKAGRLKELSRQHKAVSQSLWEVRSDSGAGRLIFVMINPDTVIVSAVHKNFGSLTQAVNRGANRWQNCPKIRKK